MLMFISTESSTYIQYFEVNVQFLVWVKKKNPLNTLHE